IARSRDLPHFPPATLRQLLRHRPPSPEPAPRGRVLLWPDTFSNFLAPEVGTAAVRVLEAAGFQVVLPRAPVCCGLTWASTGQLRGARRVLQHSLEVIGPELAAGTPVVGLEPSCTAMLRHDAAHLLPDDPLVEALPATVRTLAEVLAERAPDWQPPQVGG